MKNSIEEDIKTDKEYKEENGWHGYYNKEIVELARILQHILSDYKRVLKENEQLQTEVSSLKKENESLKQEITVLQNTKDTCPKFNTSGVRCSLKQENEELKLYNNTITSQLEQMTTEKFKNGWFHQSEFKDLILVQTVKDKIRHYQELQDNYIKKYDEINEGLQAMISALQELLESEE